MKNLFRFLSLCALLLLPFESFAQEAYKGELFVTRQQFSLLNDGQQLQVDLGIDYEGLRTPSDESITHSSGYCYKEIYIRSLSCRLAYSSLFEQPLSFPEDGKWLEFE